MPLLNQKNYRSSTAIIKTFPVSYPPKTHWPSTWCPPWYLRRPNFDLSISTVTPSPPSCRYSVIIAFNSVSRQKDAYTTAVSTSMLTWFAITFKETLSIHKLIKTKIWKIESFERLKNVSFLSSSFVCTVLSNLNGTLGFFYHLFDLSITNSWLLYKRKENGIDQT